MFWWSASVGSGGGRKKWFVCAMAIHQLDLGSCRQELTLILPRGTEQSRGKIEHQHILVHMKKLPCSGQV